MLRPDRRFWIELSYRYATPVSILQKVMTQADFIELQAEELLNPRGTVGDNCNMAKIVQAMVGGKLSDHMLDFEEPFKPKLPEASGLRQLFLKMQGA